MAFRSAGIRKQFPILDRKVSLQDGSQVPLCYLDHGASTHAATPVLEAVQRLHTTEYANIHRGNHTLSRESSDRFDGASETFARFIGGDLETNAFVMTQNTTYALDLAAHVMAQWQGATLTTRMEHHSNDLPHRRAGPVLYADVDRYGRVHLDEVEEQLQRHQVKLLAVSGASNVTGHLPPIHKLARLAHDAGARILVDGAQLYAHAPIDVKPDDHPEHIDFLAAAGHKAYAPFGGAWLWGPRDLFDAAPPYLPGGGTVTWVHDSDAHFAPTPDRHMGGTPNITGTVAFAAATEFLASVGMEAVREHEHRLTRYALKRFDELRADHGVALTGPPDPDERIGVFSFDVPDLRHEMVSAILDHEHGIATRNGCFCAQPLLNRLLGLGDTRPWGEALARGETVPLPGLVRASLGIYNTAEELDRFFAAVSCVAAGKIQARYHSDDFKSVHVEESAPEPLRKLAA